MTYEEAKKQIATKYNLGTTLVTGHKASYFEEAALLYADQFKVKNFVQPNFCRHLQKDDDDTLDDFWFDEEDKREVGL